MHLRKFLATAVLLLGTSAFAAPAPSPAPASKGPSQEQIKQAVDDLANPKFPVRERASKFLWEAGSQAESALIAASKSTDEERSKRAITILDKFAWGLYPDTPELVVKLIERFRGGVPSERRTVVGELIRMKPIRFATLRKLIGQEQNEEARTEMFRAMTSEVRRAVPAMIVANQMDEADSLLELCSSQSNKNSHVDFATFHYLRGTVPAAITRMEEVLKRGTDVERQRAAESLVHLYRVRNDWPAARKFVALTKDKVLEANLAWESNDWKTLAESEDNPDGGDDRGTRAAYHRLAGNQAKFEEIIAELRKELMGVEGDDNTAYSLAIALLLNGRGGDALNVLKDRPKQGASLTFDMLCAQLKFKDAFALADKASKEFAKDEAGAILQNELDLERAKVLANLGDRDAATQIFRGIFGRGAQLNLARNGMEAIKAVVRAGMDDLAIECVAKMLSENEKNDGGLFAELILEPLLGEKRFAAQVWWAAYRLDAPMEDPVKTLGRVLDFVRGKADRKQAERLAELINKMSERLAKGNSVPDVLLSISTDFNFALAEAYRTVGMNDKAEEHFKKLLAEKVQPSTPREFLEDRPDDDENELRVPARYKYLLAYADFLTAQKRSKDAAVEYRAAWELAPFRPLGLFLHGHTLKIAGNIKEGERLMGLSHWIALGDDAARTQFSEELSSRGFDADSRREMEIILSTGWFQSFQYGNAMVRQARIKARQKDYAAAALLYDKDVVGLTRSGAAFIEKRAYLTVPELARSYRIQALLSAGKLDAALSEARVGLENLPGNVELAISLVPTLEKAGKTKESDEIYGKVRTAFESAIKDFATSADLRNSLAWTMVNCNRDLDDAKKHAEAAVKIAPRSAGYIDTLAEIHFRRKDRTKALELMKQCAALEPRNPYYRKQLERFEKKPFDSPLPDEETGDD